MKSYLTKICLLMIFIQSCGAIVCYMCVGPVDEGCDDDPWPEQTDVATSNFTDIYTCSVRFFGTYFWFRNEKRISNKSAETSLCIFVWKINSKDYIILIFTNSVLGCKKKWSCKKKQRPWHSWGLWSSFCFRVWRFCLLWYGFL